MSYQSFIAGCAGLLAVTTLAVAAPTVTFNKDVLPILQKNCQECHRSGEIAPFSLLSYAEARPWAKSIKQAVTTRKMPPWFADPEFNHFANDKRLSQANIDTLVAWVDGGAVEGNAKDKPAPLKFEAGWNIKPDLVIEFPKPVDIPASGTVEYKYVLAKGSFPEDTWVVAAEARPGNAAVVHHIRVDVRSPASGWMKNAEPGIAYERTDSVMNSNPEGENLLGKYNPGLGAQVFDYEGAAKFVPKGSDIVFNMHYTTNGKATTDMSRVGLVFAKTPPKTTRYFTSMVPVANNLVILPGEANAEVVSETTVMNDNIRMVYVQPHMHLRGKDFELRLIYPTGETQTVFKGKWDFNWQQGFSWDKPIPLPQRHARSRHFPFRQLGQQPVQPRSEG